MGIRMMRNLVISVLVVGLLSLLPLSPRVGPSSGLLPVSISLGQDEAKAYVTYRRARVTTRAGLSSRLSSLLLPLLLRKGERGDEGLRLKRIASHQERRPGANTPKRSGE